MDTLAFAVTAFTMIFSIINPLGAIPLLVTITEGYSREERKMVIIKAVLTAAAILIIFTLFGNLFFLFFGITINSFRIAGGILLFTVGFSMMRGQVSRTKNTPEEREEAAEREEVGVIPLGIPMLAGPGSITTVMILVSNRGIGETSVVILSVLITLAIAYVLFLYGDRIFQKLGRAGTRAFSRIMGLILAAIAVQFIIEGIHGVLLQWGVMP